MNETREAGWRTIETHAGLYQVSRDGEIRHSSGRIIGQWLNSQGYALVRLSSPRMTARVHRLVAAAFIPNPSALPAVNHLDFNRANNVADNLEWCTQHQNLQHSASAGRMQRDYWKGRRSPSAKLSDAKIAEIRAAHAGGGVSWSAMGRMFGISKRSIGRIVRGESYGPQMA